jgi:predicted RNase H-like HicB family nuclease
MDAHQPTRKLLCYARSDGEGWEAFCIDLDIAVQGATFAEVVATMSEAITTYVEDARHEEPSTARRLLSRRAPWHVRLSYTVRAILHLLAGRNDPVAEASFDVHCPA